MGYTHYFKFNLQTNNKKVYEVAFNNAIMLFNYCKKYFPADLKLCDYNGEGDAEITDKGIFFNGDASKNLDCESFCLDLDKYKMGFCKTRRKPYDIAVCCMLLCMKEMFGLEFEYSSDGNCMTDYDTLSKEDKKNFQFEPEWVEPLMIFKKALNDMFEEDYSSEVFNKKLKYLPKKKII